MPIHFQTSFPKEWQRRLNSQEMDTTVKVSYDNKPHKHSESLNDLQRSDETMEPNSNGSQKDKNAASESVRGISATTKGHVPSKSIRSCSEALPRWAKNVDAFVKRPEAREHIYTSAPPRWADKMGSKKLCAWGESSKCSTKERKEERGRNVHKKSPMRDYIALCDTDQNVQKLGKSHDPKSVDNFDLGMPQLHSESMNAITLESDSRNESGDGKIVKLSLSTGIDTVANVPTNSGAATRALLSGNVGRDGAGKRNKCFTQPELFRQKRKLEFATTSGTAPDNEAEKAILQKQEKLQLIKDYCSRTLETIVTSLNTLNKEVQVVEDVSRLNEINDKVQRVQDAFNPIEAFLVLPALSPSFRVLTKVSQLQHTISCSIVRILRISNLAKAAVISMTLTERESLVDYVSCIRNAAAILQK